MRNTDPEDENEHDAAKNAGARGDGHADPLAIAIERSVRHQEIKRDEIQQHKALREG